MVPKKIYPPTYFNLSWFIMINLHFLYPIIVLYTGLWKLTGVLPIIFGVYINLAADKLMKVYSTTVKPGKESETLIENGVFKFSRNPMYLGMAIILIGIAIILGSLSPFIVIVVFVYLIENFFIKVEESMLEKKFEKKWINYKNNTRRWI
jgi:protein-S-isoprenylcysteine O-methyltransferase Ste14